MEPFFFIYIFIEKILLEKIKMNFIQNKTKINKNFKKNIYSSQKIIQTLENINDLTDHEGCVNCISYNETGKYTITGK
jgi:hypothetical protein